jgi:hypothetical protein
VFAVAGAAVATYGFAFLSGRNVSGHMGEFVQSVGSSNPEPSKIANDLSTFFGDRLEEHFRNGADPRPEEGSDVLGFLVAGYYNGVGEVHEVSLPSGTVQKQFDSSSGGAAWRGQTDVVIRLLKGFDAGLFGRLGQEGQLPEQLVAALPEILAPLQKMEYVVPFNLMTVQDAIDFVVLLIRTTIDVQRLTYGTVAYPGSWPGVGGPIEIASIMPIEGFSWVQQAVLQGERAAGLAELD